ncbi:MAG: hypothetical protein JNK65_00845 [Deltaproteobacteria bacterium]|nr:hypothetical protein [Deltaproteobacteria bacterium]
MKKLFFVFFIFSILFISQQSYAVLDEEKVYQGISYACTGVAESKEDPRWKSYPLKLMFTTANRAYISEVEVSVRDSAGKEVLKTQCDGPWFLAKLKPGGYSIQLKPEGAALKTMKVTVPASGQNEMAVRFPEISEGSGKTAY